MARQTIKKTTSTTTKVTIKIRPKTEEELAAMRSQQAKKRQRAANGRFI